MKNFAKCLLSFALFAGVKSDSQIVFECDDPYKVGEATGHHGDVYSGSILQHDILTNRHILERLELKINNLRASCSGGGGSPPLPPATTEMPARTLDDIFTNGVPRDGVYNVIIGTKTVQSYVENRDGNTWLVFQRRTQGRVDFYQNWEAYQDGFGDIYDAFWWGLEYLHEVVGTGDSYMLRIDLDDAENNTAYAEYTSFLIGDSATNYRLTVSGYRGDAGDSLDFHNNHEFTTKDRDNDDWASGNCAQTHRGAWWYNACQASNLNGEYLIGGQVNNRGVNWYHWKFRNYSMKRASMKIRPTS